MSVKGFELLKLAIYTHLPLCIRNTNENRTLNLHKSYTFARCIRIFLVPTTVIRMFNGQITETLLIYSGKMIITDGL